jgi:replicative DNA helicase
MTHFIPSPLVEPPANIQAEQHVVGTLLANARKFELIDGILEPEHFTDPILSRIFADIGRRVKAGQHADAIVLRNHYAAANVLEEVGGPGYLAELLTALMPSSTLRPYAEVIRDAWRRRRVIEIAQDACARAHLQDDADPADAIASGVATELLALADAGTRDGAVTIGAAADAALRAADAARESGGRQRGVPTGIEGLDAMLGGLRSGQLVVLGARPAVGKSAMALNVALAAARAGIGVALFSLEMSADELGERLLANLTGITGTRIRDGRLAQGEWDRLVAARHDLDALPIHVDATGGLTVERIRLRVRALARKSPIALVVIDHLGLLAPQVGFERAGIVAATEANSKAAKITAKDLGVSVLALSQLNRALEGRDDKRPGLADLRWSGSIEQDADSVIFLHREEVHLLAREPSRRADETDAKHAVRIAAWRAAINEVAGRGELIVAKQRRGPTGTVPIRFDGALCRIEDAGGARGQ